MTATSHTEAKSIWQQQAATMVRAYGKTEARRIAIQNRNEGRRGDHTWQHWSATIKAIDVLTDEEKNHAAE